MTRRDYVLIADALRQAKPPGPLAAGDAIAPAHGAWLSAVCCLALKLGQNNPRFDSRGFMAACGMGS